MFYVYLLQSLKTDDIYLGSTIDLRKRLRDHNQGRSISTKRYAPWKLIYYEAYIEEIIARMREKRLKYHGNAMKELKKRLGFVPHRDGAGFIPHRDGAGFIPHRDGAGFTLMELLIVMVILSILVAIATGSYASSSRRGRDNRRKNDLRSLTTALEAYFNDKGQYPVGSNGVMMGCGALDAQACSWGGAFRDQYNTLYMVLIPSDPISSQTYYYVSTSGTNYKVYARIENTNDAGDGVDQDGYVNTNCSLDSTIECTYGIASGDTSP